MKKPQYNSCPKSTRASYIHKLVASRLLKAPITGALDAIPVDPNTKFLTLVLGSANSIAGRVQTTDGRHRAYIDDFRVANGLQRYGIGTRLFKAFVAECKDIGVKELYSYEVSDKALGLRTRLFGEQTLRFYDDDYSEEVILPMTLEQALATNRRIAELDAIRPDRENPSGNIGVFMDLTTIDISGWERPDTADLVSDEF